MEKNKTQLFDLKLSIMLALITSLTFTPKISALDVLHPYFTVKDIMPRDLDRIGGVGGMDLLPNGDGIICSWGGSQRTYGEVWIVPNLNSGVPGTPKLVFAGLREPLGVRVVGNDFYVMEKPRILKFTESGATWKMDTLWSLPKAWYNDQQWHHFSFDLSYRDNAFWFTTGTAYPYDENDSMQRGALIRVALDGKSHGQFARGLRNTDGIGIGPDDEFFVTENQGHWKPVDVLYHIPTKDIPANGRFYGFRTKTNNACGITPPAVEAANCPSDPEFPPAIWIPYGDFSRSPTRPLMLKSGPYAGQMVSGDVHIGGILRYFLEKVNGEYQGAAFTMMQGGPKGVGFGIHQLMYTNTGNIIAGGIGGGLSEPWCNLPGGGGWQFAGECRGLALLTPTDKTPFEILSIRSLVDGFDIEFTQPANAAAADAANWVVKTSVFTPIQNYGGEATQSDNGVTVGVTEAIRSQDGKHVRLKLASLKTLRMYHIRMNSEMVKSTTGEIPWINQGYYTLNSVNNIRDISENPVVPIIKKSGIQEIKPQWSRGKLSMFFPVRTEYRLAIHDMRGNKVAEIAGSANGEMVLPALKTGVYCLIGQLNRKDFQTKALVP